MALDRQRLIDIAMDQEPPFRIAMSKRQAWQLLSAIALGYGIIFSPFLDYFVLDSYSLLDLIRGYESGSELQGIATFVYLIATSALLTFAKWPEGMVGMRAAILVISWMLGLLALFFLLVASLYPV